ncbi:hypothetical protein CVT26_000388 [Gymnopilus dilepis]|uniref:Uncharacterized protein n=1 Tax=Gymnopilus dilepis TaxID=231916 RepID=A0A409VHT6_9AGAR|nr:hypothetical protein CVT26_000388 [Gymnopilus dilepis]
MSNDLNGIWYNELGSTMSLTADGLGALSGFYSSAVGVGAADGTTPTPTPTPTQTALSRFALLGRYDPEPPSGSGGNSKGTSLGWAVAYDYAHSTATWSGQYFPKTDGTDSEETIVTHWLLTTSSTPADVWSSTNVGTDTFTRAAPDAADVAKAVEKGKLTFASPHPEQIVAALNKAK